MLIGHDHTHDTPSYMDYIQYGNLREECYMYVDVCILCNDMHWFRSGSLVILLGHKNACARIHMLHAYRQIDR